MSKKPIYPNRLEPLMRAQGFTDPSLAGQIDPPTTKQQIFKLRNCERKLTPDWARKLAPLLGVGWPEVIGDLPLAPPETFALDVGKRLQVAAVEFGYHTPEAFADYLDIPAATVRSWFSGASIPSPHHLESLVQRRGVTLDWVYLGITTGLPRGVDVRLEAAMMGMDVPEVPAEPTPPPDPAQPSQIRTVRNRRRA